MQLKSKTSKLIKSFVQLVLNTFNNKVKTIRSDNGFEFTMKEFYLKHGIHHQIVCVKHAIVERKYLYHLGVTHALLFQYHFPNVLWGLCSLFQIFLSIVYLQNYCIISLALKSFIIIHRITFLCVFLTVLFLLLAPNTTKINWTQDPISVFI